MGKTIRGTDIVYCSNASHGSINCSKPAFRVSGLTDSDRPWGLCPSALHKRSAWYDIIPGNKHWRSPPATDCPTNRKFGFWVSTHVHDVRPPCIREITTTSPNSQCPSVPLYALIPLSTLTPAPVKTTVLPLPRSRNPLTRATASE